MKKTLSTISFLMLLAVVSVSAQCCNSSAKKAEDNKQAQESEVKSKSISDVEAYYFHATRRCATCQAVEEVTKEALKDYYGEDVTFHSINRDEEKDHPLIEKHNVSGQTLLIVKGDKAENITNFAFMNARSNPDKLKEKIKSTIESL